MRVWIKDPLALYSAADAGGGLVVEGNRIEALIPAGGAPQGPVDEVFDAQNHVVLPGLINTHHHFYQTLTRAHPDAINKELFPWLTALYPIWSRLDPDSFRLAVRVALVELLLSGCTTAADHHYLYPAGLESAVDIEVEEARALGIRMTISRGSMNLSQKDGGLPPDSVVQDEDEILSDCERVLGLYHDRADSALIQVALSPCSPFSVTKSLMVQSAELAERFDCRLHTHLAETADETRFCQEHFGMRPLEFLEEVDWVGSRTWLAHGIHFTDQECEKLGRHSVGISHCPTSNAVLASGFCPTRELEACHAPLGLGVDGSASNDSSNMLEGLRHALMVNRLHYGSAAAVSHLDAIRWATEGSAACLGRRKIGRLAPGYQADMALFKLDELRFSGSHDPLAALILCGATRADQVMVAGAWRVRDGFPLGVDLEELGQLHRAAAKRFA